MNKIADQIVVIDRRARELGLELREVTVNKRELKVPVGAGLHAQDSVYEFCPNGGSLLRCRVLVGPERRLMRVENVSVDMVIHTMETLSGTK